MITVGIDEAGRGCWAGPLVAAAVILDRDIPGLGDSKKLSKKQRDKMAILIKSQAVAVSTGWVSAIRVDEIGLTAATHLAMKQALDGLVANYDLVIIDGNYNYLPDVVNVETMIKADALIPAVSAASIIAKTSRDNYMANLAQSFPNYQFEKHVGYGTALHRSLIEQFGTCEHHRLNYKPLRKYKNIKRDAS